MNILGLHFGHDGAAAVTKQGRIVSYISRERQSRCKHAIGVTAHELELALQEAEVDFEDLDSVAITSTQNIEILTGLIPGFEIDTTPHTETSLTQLNPNGVRGAAQLHAIFRDEKLGDTLQRKVYELICPEAKELSTTGIEHTEWIDGYISLRGWGAGTKLDDLQHIAVTDILQVEALQDGFHWPVTVTYKGISKPGYFVNHHMAHAANSFFQSPFDKAAIISHDGFAIGEGYQSGMIYKGVGNKIFAITPHHLALGAMYDYVADAIGFHPAGGAGKLMGLAPYGEPNFFEETFIGNFYDGVRPKIWVEHCIDFAYADGYDMNEPGVMSQFSRDLAASTQKLFEETYLKVAGITQKLLKTPNLCLTGGTALNCPSNSRIYNESPFQKVFVEPGCADDGLAIGAALYVTHQVHGEERSPGEARAYLGPIYRYDDILETLQSYGVRFDMPADANKAAAQDLADDRVIAWFEGRSEVGPRALGHRSILANPLHKANWQRVNRIKARENWRPFAPVVVEDRAELWFDGAPHPSPYMLFTGQVNTDNFPAITHVDGSARIQTVTPECGEFYRVVREFGNITGFAVLLNTSFNGPGEPIVETPEQALQFLVNSELDVLYIGGYRVTRA